MPRQSDNDVPQTSAVKPGKGEIRARVSYESERRARLGVPAFAGGVLYLLGGIIVTATLKALPTVGPLQAVAPVLRGEANPAVSPGAAEVKFVSHHAFGLIAGNLLQAVAILALLLILLFLQGAASFRRPETSRSARTLVLLGGAVMVFVSVAHPVAQVLNAHHFVTGHDYTSAAVDRALTRSAPLEITQYLGLLGGLVLAAGMIIVVLGSSRTGLLPRWMMVLGMFMAVLAFTPFGLVLGSSQQLVPAFWMVATGLLLMGRYPGGDPPAWAAGEARPWLPQARPERDSGRAGRGSGDKSETRQRKDRVQPTDEALQQGGEERSGAPPAPVQPTSAAGSGRRRRKRGSRR